MTTARWRSWRREPEGSGEVGEGLCVVVECTNGEKARYLLEEEPRFYMKGETVTVATTKVTIDYQTDAIASEVGNV